MTQPWKLTARELLIAYGEGLRDFSRANLSRANLYGATLDGANLDGATLDGANLDGATLDGATLDGATLDGATLYGATLYGATLYGATLYGATLDGANLSRANLYGADLSGANLSGANLSRATLPDGYYTVQFNHIGSRGACTVATVYPDGRHEIRTGCFCGSLDEFIVAVQQKEENDPFRGEYENIVIPGIRWFFDQHKVEVTQS